MDALSDFSSSVTEFKSTFKAHNSSNLVDSCTGTDLVVSKQDVSTETSRQSNTASQTNPFSNVVASQVDETELSFSLKKLYARLEVELLKGVTPLLDYANATSDDLHAKKMLIQPYQNITMESVANHSQGLATWLAVHTNNAPALILTTSAQHEGWCEHANQSLKLFIPKRAQIAHFVAYMEEKSITLKSCIKSLCTNSFNKNMFAGSTLDGNIYVWLYSTKGAGNNVEVVQLFSNNSQHGCAVAMDWPTEDRLLTCHANGRVQQWCFGTEMQLEESFFIESKEDTPCELSSLVSISPSVFVVGTNDGRVYHCSSDNMMVKKADLAILTLKPHLFMVSTLLKRNIGGQTVVISADISGQVYYHNLRDPDEGTTNLILQIPLPFRNAIACSQDGSIIYSPGDDGSLDCYRVQKGDYFNVKGALRGRGNFIKCSDSGLWIITGPYADKFQIFTTDL